MCVSVGERNAELMVANVAPASIRLVDTARNARVAVHHQSVGEQGVGVVRQ